MGGVQLTNHAVDDPLEFAAVAPLYRVRTVEFTDGVPIQSFEIDVIEAIPHRCPGLIKNGALSLLLIDGEFAGNRQAGTGSAFTDEIGNPGSQSQVFLRFRDPGSEGISSAGDLFGRGSGSCIDAVNGRRGLMAGNKKDLLRFGPPGGPTHSGIGTESPGEAIADPLQIDFDFRSFLGGVLFFILGPVFFLLPIVGFFLGRKGVAGEFPILRSGLVVCFCQPQPPEVTTGFISL